MIWSTQITMIAGELPHVTQMHSKRTSRMVNWLNALEMSWSASDWPTERLHFSNVWRAWRSGMRVTMLPGVPNIRLIHCVLVGYDPFCSDSPSLYLTTNLTKRLYELLMVEHAWIIDAEGKSSPLSSTLLEVTSHASCITANSLNEIPSLTALSDYLHKWAYAARFPWLSQRLIDYPTTHFQSLTMLPLFMPIFLVLASDKALAHHSMNTPGGGGFLCWRVARRIPVLECVVHATEVS